MKASTHPLTRAVLEQIVKDEAEHGRLGWLYLDWIGDALDHAERRRLALAAQDTAAGLRRVWEETPARAESESEHGHESEGEDPRASDMGWIAAEAYPEHARRALEHDVFERLASYGIEA